MKKLLLALVLVPMMGLAEEEWVNGYCWSYTISNGKAEIIPGSHGAKGSVPASAGKSGADVSASSSASTGQTATPSTPRNVIYIPSVLGGSPVTRIGDSAFCNCAWMKDDVVIPDSVTSIGQSAFDSCCEMMSVAIPSSVTEIGVNAFFACRKLEKVYVEKGDAARIKTMLKGVNVNALTFEEEKIDEAAVSRDKVLNEWYSSYAERAVPSWVMVGGDQVYVDEVSFPYVFPSSGAVLYRTQGGYRVDLKGVLLKPGPWTSNVIDADGDLSIYLEDENVIEGRVQLSGRGGILDPLPSSHRLLIFGPGKLTILGEGDGMNCAIYADDAVSIMAGATVSIYGERTGIGTGDILISGSMVGVYGSSYRAIECNNLRILAGVFSMQTTHQGIYAKGDVVIDASIVNAFTPQICVYSGNFYASNSYLALAATSLDDSLSSHSVLLSTEVSFSQCVAKIIGFASIYECDSWMTRITDACGINANQVAFGEGDYYIGLKAKGFVGSEDDQYATSGILADSFLMMGGNVRVCSPGISAISVARPIFMAGEMDVMSGMLEIQDRFDTAEMFKFDAGIVAGYTAAIGAGLFDASTASVDFYTQVFLDALSNGLLENIEGKAASSITFGNGFYVQMGGTVLAKGSAHGILTYKYPAIINGGSCHATFQLSEVGKGGWSYYEVSPVSVDGGTVNKNLKCVEYAVPGMSKYDKIAWLGTEALPPYYGTRSLYADEGGKLYFWLPDAWSGLNDKVATVLFDACYGITPEKVRIVSKGRTVGALPTPTREGFTFLGWFTAANGGSEVLTSQMVVGDVTYYAHWAKSVAPYKLTFVANGGMGTSIPPIQMEANRVYNLPKCKLTPPDNKKRFAGWAGSNGKRYDDEMLVFNLAKPGETVTMTAIWK